MDNGHFGYGERQIIDRTPWDEANAGMSRSLGLTDGEYLCVLRKMYHTFMFDVREFAVEYLGATEEQFLSALPWLTYFQTIIYELDLAAEKALAADIPIPSSRINEIGGELLHFLRANRLSDAETESALAEVMHFLSHEGEYRYPYLEADMDRIFYLLNCKTADLEILFRLAARLCDKSPSPGQMEIFRVLERVREIFDDIRDYHEDVAAKCFNAVRSLEMMQGRDKALEIIHGYIVKEYESIRDLIEKESVVSQERFALLRERWQQERRHYVQELDTLWS